MIRHAKHPIFAAALLASLLCGTPSPSRALAATGSSTAVLSNDARYQPIQAQAGAGNGQDEGTYLPALAGPQSEIVGTVEPTQGTGPTTFFVGAVDGSGRRSFWRGVTDQDGHFDLRVPAIAGLMRLVVFRQFDKHGQPDNGATCQIGPPSTHVAETEAVPNAPMSGPAIVEANTAYQRGGWSKGVFDLHTRNVDPFDVHPLVDGRADTADLLAASDESVVGRFHDDVPLGRHTLGLISDGRLTNAQPIDLLSFSFRPFGSLRPGQVRNADLVLDGLNGDRAVVEFTVTGSARVAGGGDLKVVPVENGVATCPVQGVSPGGFLVSVVVHVDQLLSDNNGGGAAGPGGGPGAGPPAPTPLPTGGAVPVEEQTPPPTPLPTPHAVPTEAVAPCDYRVLEGDIEPTQGVWQDDYEFDDHGPNHGNSGKQIVADPTAKMPVWDAQIPMIAGRDTLLFGIAQTRHAFPHIANNPGDRDWIAMKIQTNCVKYKLVRMGFVLHQPGEPPVALGTSKEKFPVPLLPPKGPEQTVVVKMYVPEGFPYDHRFTFKPVGSYVIVAALSGADDESGTGLAMAVRGTVNTTRVPELTFRPLILSKGDSADLQAKAKNLAYWTTQMIGDYYPIVPGSVTANVKQTEDLTSEHLAPEYVSPYHEPKTDRQQLIDALKGGIQAFDNWQRLRDRLGAGADIAGAGRVVVVLNNHDYDLVDAARLLGSSSNGVAIAAKVVVVRDSVSYKTVMHELAHTFPYVWSTDEMWSECFLPGDYHNHGGKWAFGERMYLQGAPERFRVENSIPFMTDSDNLSTYIAQCTYWNLANQLARDNDPPITLVRGVMSRTGGRVSASFSPFYEFMGISDVAAGKAGVWNIIVRSAGGGVLATYPIRDPFTLNEDERALPSNTFAYRIPTPPAGATIELRGPNVDLSRQRGLQAPTLSITSPSRGASVVPVAGKVRVHWAAASSSRLPLVATVLYSADGGTLVEQAFETKGSSFDVTLDRGAHRHHIRVMVTDGSRSVQADATFTTP